jgi:hypothetical protein
LLFAGNGQDDFLMAFEPDQAVGILSLGEACVLFPFVVEDALLQVAGYTYIQCVAAAGHCVGEVKVLRHRRNGTD